MAKKKQPVGQVLGRIPSSTRIVTITDVYDPETNPNGSLVTAETVKEFTCDGGGSVTADDTLSDTSTNPIQNQWLGKRLGATEKNSIQIGYGAKAGYCSGTGVDNCAWGDNGNQVAIGHSADGSGAGTAIGYCAEGWLKGTGVGWGAKGDSCGAAVGAGADGGSDGAAVGFCAKGNSSGAAVGFCAKGNSSGAAVGHGADGSRYGVAVGAYAVGCDCSVAVGYSANSCRYGVAVGYSASGSSYGVAVGSGATGSDRGVAVGCHASGDGYGVAIGVCAFGDCRGVAIGAYATGANGRVAIGNNATASDDTPIVIGSACHYTNAQITVSKAGVLKVGGKVVGDGGGGGLSADMDPVVIGSCAATTGEATTWKGSVVVGGHASSWGEAAVAVGEYAGAGHGSIAIGAGADAEGHTYPNVAIGSGAVAKGSNAITIGNDIGNSLAKSAMLSAFNPDTGTHAFLRIIAGSDCTDTYLEFGRFDTLNGDATSAKVSLSSFSGTFLENGGIDGVTQGIIGGNSMYGYNG